IRISDLIRHSTFDIRHSYRWTMIRMTKSERSPKPEIRTKRLSPVAFDIRISDLIRHSTFVIRHSYRCASMNSALRTPQEARSQKYDEITASQCDTPANVRGSPALTQ